MALIPWLVVAYAGICAAGFVTTGTSFWWGRRNIRSKERVRNRLSALLGALALCKRAHCVAASEDTRQTLLVIEYQHRACAALPHIPAGFLHRLALCQCHELLAFDDIRELSVDHRLRQNFGAWFELVPLPHGGRLELDPRQKLIELEGAHLRSVGTIKFAGGSHFSLLRYVQFPVGD